MVRTHRLGPATLLASVLLAALAAGAVLGAAGCGSVSGAASSLGNQLTVYSSLPLQGASASTSRELVNGEKLALYDAGGAVGPFKVSYVSLDDASPTSGRWDPGVTASNAKTAADDPSTIAYLGDYDSAATAVSLPLINAAGILQVSPWSPYGGLTSSLDAGQDEPERFYPTAKRNFARLQPGDAKQARAQAQMLRSLGVNSLYVLNDEDPFEQPLAQMVVSDAERGGIKVVGQDSLDTSTATSFTGEVAKIAEHGPQAVFLAGSAKPGAAALFQQLHEADPKLWLLGPSTLADPSFTAKLGAATAARTLLSTPVLPVKMDPPPAQDVLAGYRKRFGEDPGAHALLGYEAMSATLGAIRAAGTRGNDRQAVIDAFFAAAPRTSVIGRYAIEPDGETTLSHYGVDRVLGGQPVFWRVLEVG